ncbi:MAG: hypothetical protein A2648_02470 [Candidatus Lloydbacteria bacterium RIFCSPHIGHO2_01_FULL_41_20]|uniref:Histidine kinase N-terminal 7TM region domain-containing protein n=1 Tax=Candidatus Lloydbacteria bacterium RIFCSPHIGHO2_01_FULL_41_20 TaxID=1798657 RepID=A0A1G2CQY2_9BACT|nr:MAG: hypothetical protein A2648_02470 [Candidatus Lloydbacteria bacterium RIFCSPHIGHO2_01_FULL_41_20]
MMLITPIFYITGALFSLTIAIGTYFSYREAKNKGLWYLALSFLFLSLHSFSLSVPSLIDGKNLILIAWGYILGMIFLYLLLLSALRVQTALHRGFMWKHSFIINTIILGIGVSVIWILVSDFHLPVISPRGTIFWNVNPVAGWLTGITSLIYGLMWADFFQQEKNMVSQNLSKIKMSILSFDGIMLGIAGLLVFTSNNETETIIGHSLFILACVLTLITLILPSKK